MQQLPREVHGWQTPRHNLNQAASLTVSLRSLKFHSCSKHLAGHASKNIRTRIDADTVPEMLLLVLPTIGAYLFTSPCLQGIAVSRSIMSLCLYHYRTTQLTKVAPASGLGAPPAHSMVVPDNCHDYLEGCMATKTRAVHIF